MKLSPLRPHDLFDAPMSRGIQEGEEAVRLGEVVPLVEGRCGQAGLLSVGLFLNWCCGS